MLSWILELTDIIFEAGSAIPWLYRGWLYLLSANYRRKMHLEYRDSGVYSKFMDITLCIVFMVAEVVLVIKIFQLTVN